MVMVVWVGAVRALVCRRRALTPALSRRVGRERRRPAGGRVRGSGLAEETVPMRVANGQWPTANGPSQAGAEQHRAEADDESAGDDAHPEVDGLGAMNSAATRVTRPRR
jgi:hypothetical protein